MKIEIDLSGKIENTNRLSVVAFSNSKHKSILISAKDKKTIQSIFRKIEQPRMFAFKVFVAMIYCLAKEELLESNQIIIDLEYPGYQKLIKSLIKEIAEKNKLILDDKLIYFKSIGKKSNAHKVAIEAFRKKKTDMRLSVTEFYKIVF